MLCTANLFQPPGLVKLAKHTVAQKERKRIMDFWAFDRIVNGIVKKAEVVVNFCKKENHIFKKESH